MEKFEQFIPALKQEWESVKNENGPSGIVHLERLLFQVEDMVVNDHLKSIENSGLFRNITGEEIRSDIRIVLEKNLQQFKGEKEMLARLKEISGGFFSISKGYQLSHIQGFLKDEVFDLPTMNEEIKNYIIFLRHVDYYESFLGILLPFLSFRSGIKRNAIKGEKIIAQIGEVFPDSILNEFFNGQYKEIRNKMGHANFLFEDKKVFEWNRNTNCIDKTELNPINNILMMINLFVVTATEIDLFILRLGIGKGEGFAPEWKDYFENYVKWFSKIGNFND